MKKLFLFTLIIAVLAIMPLAAGGSSQRAPVASDGPAKITVFSDTNWAFPESVDLNNNPYADIFKQFLPDIDINWMIVNSAGFAERKSTLVGAGMMPDMVLSNQNELLRWSDMGLTQPVTNYIDEYYPMNKVYFTPDKWKAVTLNNQIWGIITPASPLQNPITMRARSDWLENLGKKVPTTIDEFYDIAYAFTHGDPNKDGRGNTYGVVGITNMSQPAAMANMDPIWMAFGVLPCYNNWTVVNGRLLPDIIRPETKTALAFFRKMYENGIMNKETFTILGPRQEEIITAGLIGFPTFFTNGLTRMNANIKVVAPKAELISVPPLIGPTGQRGLNVSAGINRMYAVSADCKYPWAPVKIINWLVTPDPEPPYKSLYADRVQIGGVLDPAVPKSPQGEIFGGMYVQGDNTNPDLFYKQGYWFLTMGMIQIDNTASLAIQKLRADENPSIQHQYQDLLNAADFGRSNQRHVVGPLTAQYEPDLVMYYQEVASKIVTGELPIDEFDRWVNFYNNNGGAQVIEEANRLN